MRVNVVVSEWVCLSVSKVCQSVSECGWVKVSVVKVGVCEWVCVNEWVSMGKWEWVRVRVEVHFGECWSVCPFLWVCMDVRVWVGECVCFIIISITAADPSESQCSQTAEWKKSDQFDCRRCRFFCLFIFDTLSWKRRRLFWRLSNDVGSEKTKSMQKFLGWNEKKVTYVSKIKKLWRWLTNTLQRPK